MSAIAGCSSVMPVSTSTRIGMVDDVHVDRHPPPSTELSATKTGVMVIEVGAFIVYRPPRWWLIRES